MAVAITVGKPDSDGLLEVLIVETDVGSADEVGPIVDDNTNVKPPARGTIVRYSIKLISGTGTTVDPEMGNSAVWTTGDALEEILASNALAPTDEFSDQSVVRYFDNDRSLFQRSNVNDATGDHAITTRILIREGWNF